LRERIESGPNRIPGFVGAIFFFCLVVSSFSFLLHYVCRTKGLINVLAGHIFQPTGTDRVAVETLAAFRGMWGFSGFHRAILFGRPRHISAIKHNPKRRILLLLAQIWDHRVCPHNKFLI